MASLRLCTHIKTNGQKCGSPALRHHTLCYFHYQWQRRDQRRIRLGGPVGMNKNSGIELPLLDGPEAILLSIMEIQHGLLDQRIPIKMGTALLYSLQLALQAKISAFGLGHSSSVRECPELDMELELERARAMRPAKEKCAACPKQDDCLSPRNCRKLPKLPSGYRRQGDHLVRDPDLPSTQACHPERSAAVLRGAEGPFVPSFEATVLDPTSISETTAGPLRENNPAGNCGEQAPPKFPPSSAEAQRQIVPSEEKQTVLRLRDSRRSAQDDTSDEQRRTRNEEPTENGEQRTANPLPISILRSKPNGSIDLAGKFPQLTETTQPKI